MSQNAYVRGQGSLVLQFERRRCRASGEQQAKQYAREERTAGHHGQAPTGSWVGLPGGIPYSLIVRF
jgi:hypothetical protein